MPLCCEQCGSFGRGIAGGQRCGRQLHFVTSPSAAGWPKGSRGSGRELALSELIAVKPPLKFRFLEAAGSQRVFRAHSGQSDFSIAAGQPNQPSKNQDSIKRPLAPYPAGHEPSTTVSGSARQPAWRGHYDRPCASRRNCVALIELMGRTTSRAISMNNSALAASVRFFNRIIPMGIFVRTSNGRTRRNRGAFPNRSTDPYITVMKRFVAINSYLTSMDIVVTAGFGNSSFWRRNSLLSCNIIEPSVAGNSHW